MGTESLLKHFGIKIGNPALLEEALTHSSYTNENPQAICNERLEFLGDAVLGLILADKLFQQYPGLDEGALTHLRSWLVRRGTLFEIARQVQLGDHLLMGKGEESSGGRTKSSNLAGAMEAVIAAIFLDQGWEATRQAVLRVFSTELERLDHEQSAHDYKSRVQELVQARFKITPVYRIIDESGPDHARHFTAEIAIGEEFTARGSGRSKKLAESEAARMALEQLE